MLQSIMLKNIQNQERQGEMYIFLEILLWSLFPVITILSYSEVSPLVSLAWSTLFAAVFFAINLSMKKKWHELRDKDALKDIVMITLLIGIGYYSLYFLGLQYTTAGNASIIGLSEVLFSYLFFNVVNKEPFSKNHTLGAIMLVIGASIVFLPKAGVLNIGDFLIILALATAPFGNYFQRRARERVSSDTIMFGRSALSILFLFPFAYFLGNNLSLIKVQNSLIFLLINGVLLLGLSKLLWLEGIHRMSVTKASALGGLIPLFTLLFAWLLLGEIPTSYQLIAFIPMFIGVLLVTNQKKS